MNVKRFWWGLETKKLLNIFLLLTSLIGYLEWGKDHYAFIFQVEGEALLKWKHNAETLLHPFILLPLCGQILLLITVFQKKPRRIVSLLGLTFLSTIMLMLFFIGLITFNMKIMLSAIPFIITGIFVLKFNVKINRKK